MLARKLRPSVHRKPLWLVNGAYCLASPSWVGVLFPMLALSPMGVSVSDRKVHGYMAGLGLLLREAALCSSKQGVHSGEFLHGVRQGIPTMTTTQRPMSLLQPMSRTPVSLLHNPRARLSIVQKSTSEGCFGDTTEAPNRIVDATSAGWPVKWTEAACHTVLREL